MSCPLGDYAAAAKYTVNNTVPGGVSSAHNWCAPARVQAQLSDQTGSGFEFEQQGGQSVTLFSWNGTLSQEGTLATQQSGNNIREVWNVAPGSTPAGASQGCPAAAIPGEYGCEIYIASDGRDIVKVFNVGVFQIIGSSSAALS